jgi:hypothetical protein
MKEDMPPAPPPGLKQDIAPARRSAQSLGLNVRPSRVMPWMKIWRGGAGFIDDCKTANCVLCLGLLRRNKQQGYMRLKGRQLCPP